MKKLIATILAIVFLLTLFSGCGLGSVRDVRKVSFEDTELTVTLGTNKSTGYEWSFEIIGGCIRQSINKSFKITGRGREATGEVNIGFEGRSKDMRLIACCPKTPRSDNITPASV